MSLFPPDPANPTETIHAHCDGGSRGNPGPSGYGAVITDSHGQTIAELSDFLGIRTNNFAEYSGLLAVLDYALAHNHPNVKLVSDSELMVKQIQGKYKVNSPDLKPLWQEARNRIAKLQSFQISHALRHKNKEADALANAAMDRGMGRDPDRGMGRDPDRGMGRDPDRGMGRTPASAPVDSLPLRPKPTATPYPTRSTAPPDPYAANRPAAPTTMLRGFTKDGTVHLLGGASLPDGIFVKIIPE